MSLISLWSRIFALSLAVLLSACGGGGSSAPAPTGFQATAGGGQVVLTWNAQPGVTYWMMYASNAGVIDLKNPPANGLWITPVTSPYVLAGLVDGTSYSFALNGRVNGGPGGPSVNAVATPRPAGGTVAAGTKTWTEQTALAVAPTSSSHDLHGITYGQASDLTYKYVAVGDGGTVYSGLDLINSTASSATYGQDTVVWSALTLSPGTANGAQLPQFKASLYVGGQYFAAGTGGTDGSNPVNIYRSTDAISWAASSTAVGGLNALTTNGYVVVGVGDGGLVATYNLTTGVWTTTTVTPPVTNPVTPVPDFKSVTYSPLGMWVAVGTGGAVWTSTDDVTWTSQTAAVASQINSASSVSMATVQLNGVAASSTGLLIAVGQGGAIISSPDGVNWALNRQGGPDLYAVNADPMQFMVLGAGGQVFSAVNPSSVVNSVWAPVIGSWNSYLIGSSNSNLSGTLANTVYALYGNSARYVAVGAAGENLIGQ